MKKTIYLLLVALLFSSCTLKTSDSSSSKYNQDSSFESTEYSSISESINSEDSGFKDSSSDYLSSSSEITETRTVSLYGINDFHGSVIENGYETGISKVGGFLKSKKAEGNTLLINSGDMWQGSIESNHNYGNLLTDCMNEIEFDCFTIGNHEFDWGASYINLNRERKGPNGNDEDGYQTPFLAANIFNFDIDTKTVKDYANLGDKYVIRTLENGLKVGIIGIIGEDQITSIASQYADDYTFLDPIPIIKELSDELRLEKKVDVVVLDAHTNQQSLTDSTSYYGDNSGLTSISKNSNKRYVDAVFCAHSHRNEAYEVNGVPFVQGSSNGKMYSNVELEVSPAGEVKWTKYGNTYTSYISDSYKDENIEKIVSKYKALSDVAGKEILGNVNYDFDKSDTLPNFVVTAFGNYAINCGYSIDYAISNVARDNLSSGQITYADLYKALPFDNEVYIIDVKGSDIYKELVTYSSNYFYRLTNEALDQNKTYRIAVIDYLAFHRSNKRVYNYFPTLSIVDKLSKDGYPIYNYRDITADYMRSLNGTINPNNYSSSNNRYNSNLLMQSI